jgi:holo-[acyl-carrier protein] synthase
VATDALGKPSLRVTGTIADAARARGISEWHLSLSHDGGHAIAFVVAEGASHA